MARPAADLGALTVPKIEPEPQPLAPAPAMVAPPPSPPPAPAGTDPKAYAHTLSLRLTADEYRRLRRYVAREEDRTGRRLTHQAVITAALAAFLDGAGG